LLPRLWGLDEEVVVVVHQDIGVQRPAKDAHGLAQEGEKPVPSFVIAGKRAAFMTAGRDMIEGAGEFQAERTGHRREMIAWHSPKVKTLRAVAQIL